MSIVYFFNFLSFIYIEFFIAKNSEYIWILSCSVFFFFFGFFWVFFYFARLHLVYNFHIDYSLIYLWKVFTGAHTLTCDSYSHRKVFLVAKLCLSISLPCVLSNLICVDLTEIQSSGHYNVLSRKLCRPNTIMIAWSFWEEIQP